MFTRFGILAISFFAAQTVLMGCGSNDVIKEDPVVAKKRLDAAASLRSYYDKSGGSFDALSEDDKKAVVAICKSEANARTAFGHMMGAPPSPSGERRPDLSGHSGPEGAKVGH